MSREGKHSSGLPLRLAEDLKKVLENYWEEEALDFSESEPEEQEEHIFPVLVRLDQFLHGHNKTPEQFLKESGLIDFDSDEEE